MTQEFEAKFLNIPVNDTIVKLNAIGATLVHDKEKYIRAVYFMADPKIKGYCRVRSELGTVYLTAKTYTLSADFPQEFELALKNTDKINAFDQAQQFLNALGLVKKAYHESYRIKYDHPLAHEITFDTIPGLPTYMEIDCVSKEKLDQLIELLNLPLDSMRYGAYDKTYNEYYGIPLKVINDETPFLTFGNIINEIKPSKNVELLHKLAKGQKDL